MEQVVSILGLVAGLAGFASAFFSRIRISSKNNSIEIKFGHKEKDPEVIVSDIRHITIAEIEQIKAKLSDLDMESDEVSRRE